MHGPFLPGNWAENKNVKPIPYDPEKSLALLAEMGWKKNEKGKVRGGELTKMGKKISPDLERRRYPRLRDHVFVFGILRSNPDEELKAFTKDISAGGFMFEAERSIPEESRLELEIYQPAGCHHDMFFSLSVLAKVIWVNKIEKDHFEKGENKFRIGVKFLKIKKEDRKRIAGYVEQNG